MAKITNEAVKASYNVAKQVHAGSLRQDQATDILNSEYGMNKVSASLYVQAYKHMLAGDAYKRKINAYATEHFLRRIKEDIGNNALKKAVDSVSAHIVYFKNETGTTLTSVIKIRDKFQKKLSKGTSSKKLNSKGADRKFDSRLLEFFGAAAGAYSQVTGQEAKKGQVTFLHLMKV